MADAWMGLVEELRASMNMCLVEGLCTEDRLLDPELTSDEVLSRAGLDEEAILRLRRRQEDKRREPMSVVLKRLRDRTGHAELVRLFDEVGSFAGSPFVGPQTLGEPPKEVLEKLLWAAEDELTYCLKKCARKYMRKGNCLTIVGMDEREFHSKIPDATLLDLDPLGRNGTRKQNNDPPMLFHIKERELVLCVPPGRDITRMYMQAHTRLSSLMLQESVNIRVWCGEARIVDFEPLRRFVVNSIVCVGAVDAVVDSCCLSDRLTVVPEETVGIGEWTVRTFKTLKGVDGAKLDNAVRVVFLGYRRSFWGDVAGQIGEGLCRLGPAALLHVGSKVGVVFDKGAVRRALVVPTSLTLMDSRGHGIGDAVDIPNVLHAHAGLVDVVDGQHHSLPSPLDEHVDLVNGWAREQGRNWRSVDCEGSYFAQACSRHNVRFGAAYVGSDVVAAFWKGEAGAGLVAFTGRKPELELEKMVYRRIKEVIYKFALASVRWSWWPWW
jgi:hypothetical protein